LLVDDWSVLLVEVLWASATEPSNSAALAPKIMTFFFMVLSPVP
jgi:hypothetical protein